MINKYQDKFGYPLERTKGKVKPAMAAWIQEFIRHSPFCILATRQPQRRLRRFAKRREVRFCQSAKRQAALYT